MPKTNQTLMPDYAVLLINSLGGPPLPTGVTNKTMKIILENRAAAEAKCSNYRIASNLVSRKR